MSPSIPTISVTWVMRRTPSFMRVWWTNRLRAEATCSRIARIPRSIPAISIIVSTRDSASRGEFEWMVVIDPSWPVFMACIMSRASPPRTSPTTILSGRMRRAFRTRSRIVTSPRPSMFGGRYSRRTTCGCWSRSSAESSIVRMRSSSGRNDDSTFSVVVFPAPVPPETRMFRRPRTQASRSSTVCLVRVPNEIRSSAPYGSAENFRMVRQAPSIASGGMTAFTREPSGRRASTYGDVSSTRRPTLATILSMIWRS